MTAEARARAVDATADGAHQRGRPSLVRAIGRWALAAAVVNSVIGSGIFGLPSAVAGHVGPWAPLAVLLAGACIFIVVLCFAEVGSRFEDGGGPYLYARAALGPAIGFQVGWLHLWTRLLSGAAVLNVFVAYLASLLPAAGTPTGRVLAMIGGVALVTAINVRGVRQASWTVNLFTLAKLLPLLLVAVVGFLHLSPEVLATQVVPRPSWTDAVLLLVFAYGGFESAVVAAGESRDPKRDTAFALIAAMAVVTLLYCLVQLVVVGVLPNAAQSTTPVSAALGEMFGGAGLALGGVAVLISVYGWLTGFSLMTPRIYLSMAERGELPAVLGRVHPRHRTPHVAIVVNSGLALALGLYGNFAQTATLAAIVRLGIYASTCAALVVLRRRAPEPPPFRLPGGELLAVVGIGFCAWLLATRSLAQVWVLAGIMGAGALLRLALRRRSA